MRLLKDMKLRARSACGGNETAGAGAERRCARRRGVVLSGQRGEGRCAVERPGAESTLSAVRRGAARCAGR